MTELEKIERAKLYIEKLAQGINPLDDSELPPSDIINNVRISRCLFYVLELLEGVSKYEKKKNKTPRAEFYITEEELSRFNYTSEPRSISQIVNELNSLINIEERKKLQRMKVLEWLLKIGMIELNEDGKRVPTDQGFLIGLSLERRRKSNGYIYEYIAYDLSAQQFLIDNIPALIEYLNTQK
ncbi:MAG: hypothetical protein J6B34_05260 [Clostridia bacterium]|nr:hypothetical protein [Clostridia bacterium]